MTDLGLTYDQVMAEIERYLPKGRSAKWDSEADRCLIAARKKGMPWREVTELFKAAGWPSSGNTLRDRLRELESRAAK